MGARPSGPARQADGEAGPVFFTSAAELGARIRGRELSPVDVVEEVLARVGRSASLNAFITVTAEAARAQAKEAEREIAAGRHRGPLHGIPISLKDLIDTRGIRTTCGSRILADRVPRRDATVAARLREAGAILIGKAALHEFAYGVTTNNPHFGPTRNPWNLECIPGGSSGGSAAAVAAGLGPVSIGTDTGGSIRIPAALCGIVGLKPSYGRVSRHGVQPLAWTLDHVGPLTRSVEDAALVLQAVAGPDPRDPTTQGQSVPDFTEALRRPVQGLAVGVLADDYHQVLAEDVRTAYEAALGVLRKLGLRLENVRFPRPAEAGAAQTAIIMSEAASVHERWLRDRPDEYGADTRARLQRGQFLTATQYLRAQRVRALILEEVANLFRSYAALVVPTTPCVAPRISQETTLIGDTPRDVRDMLTRMTRLLNFTGLPAISVPCGVGAGDLPVGLQIIGRPMDEATVLAIAHAFERATPWHARRPPNPPEKIPGPV
jgi:aspartyl-tRNA(Asn)/glutamyl-tRNA(Gln) amidotransferase subunit A